jgi:hypothetical protein
MFPDPAQAAVRGERVALLPLPKLIRQRSLPRQMTESLDPSARAKYDDLWQAGQTPERE